MKKMLTIAAAALVVAAAIGCSAQKNSVAMTSSIGMTVVGLPDGRSLTCALYAPNSDVAAIDCDWSHASSDIAPDADTPLASSVVVTPDERSVTCVIYAVTSSSGAVSCDWANS